MSDFEHHTGNKRSVGLYESIWTS